MEHGRPGRHQAAARRRAAQAARRRFAPGGLLHYGQGKWYPGESLPRWALGCYWRTDGVPVWENPELSPTRRATTATAGRCPALHHGAGGTAGRRSPVRAARLRGRLVLPLEGAALPVNVDPRKSNLDDPEERHRLAQVFEQGLDQVVGYALPLPQAQARANAGRSRWVSDRWLLRRGNMFLCRAIRRWAFACRWSRSPGPARRTRRALRRA